jgi:hypothetical protein
MRKISTYTVLLAIVALSAASCKKDYFNLTSNPNQVTTPTLPGLLSTATHKSGINNYNVGSIAAVYVQYTANPGAAASSDIYQIVDYSGTWDALYYAMADIHDMKDLAIQKGSSEYRGVANVLWAYNLGLAADLWGSIPYKESFNPAILTPKYDTQEEVYAAGLTLLDSAIIELTKTDATIKLQASSDLIHGGDRTKWLKTANALKARMLIKVSKTASYKPADVLATLANAYTANADDAGMASFQLRNNWAGVAVSNAANTLGGWLSEQLIDHLNGVTYGILDPRIAKITDKTVNGTYIGTVNGAGNRPPGANTTKDECYITVNSPWTSPTAPLLLVTYAELKFIEAEAALGTDPTRAYNAYLAGIRANMDKLQVAAADRDAYLASPIVAVGAANLTKALIFKEKYVATYLNPEAWNDVRRNDYQYKDFTLPQNAVLSTFIRRLEYPSLERSENGPNVPPSVPLSDRLWWDK